MVRRSTRLIGLILVVVSIVGAGCGDNLGLTPPAGNVGTVVLDPSPDSIQAPWLLVGPDLFSESGAGDHTLDGLSPGEYTVTWGAVDGYATPASQSQALIAGSALTFTAQYDVEPHTITIDPEPDSIDAPWQLAGPAGFDLAGRGNATLPDRDAGDYTLTWGDVPGWATPDPGTVTQTLAEDGTLTFHGVYIARLEFVYVPPGSFVMGSPPGEPERGDDEVAHDVTLTRGFWISMYEVSEELWSSMMGGGSTQSRLPATNVTWEQALEFCNLLSVQQGLVPAYRMVDETWTWDQAANGFRLPTEAEWEFACRAGSDAALANGQLTSADCEPVDANLDAMGWYCGNSEVGAAYVRHTVGQKQANAWGLYDMHGNVCEWCWDWYGGYSPGAVTDPVGPETGYYRVIRGGDFSSPARDCRSAHRFPYYVAWPIRSIGLRLVRSVG
ncbi:MAG TPA: formylglycine-generating enzyme family protein [Candidatus Krumholzibacteria bacterium]|nr:formylglycine-generating enzyme family protein [Candidatus Krumholzibacteria bacterium]HPD72567.1 formylglycine-generating enzyme family protein [Candidatus Krumholzibacteria bacterium]HRY40501.1 formylglycine-generating enzyme family protein [Candidatus Krumholzibacteria bacterium]